MRDSLVFTAKHTVRSVDGIKIALNKKTSININVQGSREKAGSRGPGKVVLGNLCRGSRQWSAPLTSDVGKAGPDFNVLF